MGWICHLPSTPLASKPAAWTRKDTMVALNDYEDGLGPEGLLWLEVRHGGRAHTFCCAPAEERAIVLGSLPHADIRVAGLAIAPVHFHFERDGDRLVVVPGYNAELRVNAMLARGPVALPGHAVLEFSGIRIEAFVHSRRPESADAPSLDIPERESGIAYLSALPTETQTTKLALEAYPHVDNIQAGIETCENPLGRNDEISRTQRIVRSEHDHQTTEVMERLEVITAPIPAQPQHTVRMERVSPDALRRPVVEATPVIETRRIQPAAIVTGGAQESAPPPKEIPSSPAGLGWQETTAFDLDSLREDLAATSAPVVTATVASTAPPPQTMPVSSLPTSDKSSLPLMRRIPAPRPSALGRVVTRLGEHAKTRPAMVAGGGLGASVAFALILVGLAHVFGPGPKAAPSLVPTSTTSVAVPVAIATTPTLQADVAGLPTLPKVAEPVAASASSKLSEPQRAAAPSASPEAVAAAHLMAGRHLEARAAYAELSAVHPENPAYQIMTRLLEKRTGPSCGNRNPSPSCPEIVP
jgi:hypothetical protein